MKTNTCLNEIFLFPAGRRTGIRPHHGLFSIVSCELPSRSTSSSSCCWYSPAWYRCQKTTTAALYLTTSPDLSILCCVTLMDLLRLNPIPLTNSDQKVCFQSWHMNSTRCWRAYCYWPKCFNKCIYKMIFFIYSLRKAILLRIPFNEKLTFNVVCIIILLNRTLVMHWLTIIFILTSCVVNSDIFLNSNIHRLNR